MPRKKKPVLDANGLLLMLREAREALDRLGEAGIPDYLRAALSEYYADLWGQRTRETIIPRLVEKEAAAGAPRRREAGKSAEGETAFKKVGDRVNKSASTIEKLYLTKKAKDKKARRRDT